MSDLGGRWVTISGRKVFIKDGQDLATAMKDSGKFGNVKQGNKIDAKSTNEEFVEKALKYLNEDFNYYDEVIDFKKDFGYEEDTKELDNAIQELEELDYDDVGVESAEESVTYNVNQVMEDIISKLEVKEDIDGKGLYILNKLAKTIRDNEQDDRYNDELNKLKKTIYEAKEKRLENETFKEIHKTEYYSNYSGDYEGKYFKYYEIDGYGFHMPISDYDKGITESMLNNAKDLGDSFEVKSKAEGDYNVFDYLKYKK